MHQPAADRRPLPVHDHGHAQEDGPRQPGGGSTRGAQGLALFGRSAAQRLAGALLLSAALWLGVLLVLRG